MAVRLPTSDASTLLPFPGQNTEAEAHQQLSYAWDAGINFLDTAGAEEAPAARTRPARHSPLTGGHLTFRAPALPPRAAEMYPIPTKAETQGRTDLYIGTWMKSRRREDVVLATKVCAQTL
jgi:predicted aldo/keto reductase-like oxidoreductase